MSEFTDYLRTAADWFDAHPDLPTPSFLPGFDVFVATRTEFAKILRALGHAEKGEAGDIFYVRAPLGEGRVDFNIARTEVCERVVVGHRTVPRSVVEEHVEEVVRWECHSILAEDADTEAVA